MKKLIIVRHGEYDSLSGDLNQSGFYQMKLLSEKMSKMNGSVGIFSSGVLRADKSAKILQENLCPNKGVEILEILNYQPVELTRLRARKIQRKARFLLEQFDNVIFVTHMGVVNNFPGIFMQKEWGTNRKKFKIQKGSCIILDIEKKSHTEI